MHGGGGRGGGVLLTQKPKAAINLSSFRPVSIDFWSYIIADRVFGLSKIFI